MQKKLERMGRGDVSITPEKTYFMQTTYQASGNLLHRRKLIRDYMLSLSTENLLRNYLLEAGLWNSNKLPDYIHSGWESPTSQLRGHFLGHWLSAAAQLYAETGDMEIKGKADAIVSRLEDCQKRNGGEWVFSIPEKYLDWIARGEIVWAPQYTLHKTLMGLWDMYAYAQNLRALEILKRAANWFIRWSEKFDQEQFEKILNFETGGMLEIWAELYGKTKDERYLALLNKYWRRTVYDPLIQGEDMLTNLHANTTIPEVIGAARAWEVTGQQRWRDLVEAYWKSAVTTRGFYVTGGQTNGEAWTPPKKLSSRFGKNNQEHCTVYNMMRLAGILYEWTGDTSYADYWERNLINGLLAQENPQSGMVAYYLPMEAGNQKKWGHPTEDFWCCHGTLVQAPSCIAPNVYWRDGNGIRISQYYPSKAVFNIDGVHVEIQQNYAVTTKPSSHPRSLQLIFDVESKENKLFPIVFRVPWWVVGEPRVIVDDKEYAVKIQDGLFSIERIWSKESIHIEFKMQLVSVPLPDDDRMVAFMEGPVVLAGLCDKETTLYLADGEKAENLLMPHNELSCETWRTEYKTIGQAYNIRFVPLHTIIDEKYSIYFPLRQVQ